ncbi:MAG: ATP-dependent DNA helicase RecG [Planctomycetota bacterium]|nr:ATP-dependent DNA helicase RecG [Planctomycetota bacterium]
MAKLSDSVQYLKGVGPKRAALLAGMGIRDIGDVLQFFPRKYVDRGDIVPIAKVRPGQDVAVRAKILEMRSPRWGDRLEAAIADSTGTMRVIWFHARFLVQSLATGAEFLFYGRVGQYRGQLQLQHPKFERVAESDAADDGDRILVEYPATEGLQQASLHAMVREALRIGLPLAKETLPEEMRRRLALPDLVDALRKIHQPRSMIEVREARRRLVFGEFFLMELAVALRRRSALASHNAPPVPVSDKVDERIRARFPFRFTAAQDRVIAEIRGDLGRDRPMTRLLQGDVGSGKTAVALYAALAAVAAGYQAAIMAPTEILATQHYHNVEKYLVGSRVRWALLVGGLGVKERKNVLRRIRNEDADIIVATHALLQQDVTFSRLGLVVIDEQHKFGVLQRAEVKWQPAADNPLLQPHYLVMTATPIPRTLALTVFGDLDVSTIDEMPPGRTPIATWWVRAEERRKAYTFVRKELAAGRQAFIVCPLVEENENSDLKAATEEAARLQEEVFGEFHVGLLHGRMKPEEKDAVMDRFRRGEIHVLVSTVVIEVGVDVPNASVMIVEHAERFGLAQLHQLRGRIGRGAAKSSCLLMGEPVTPEAQRRLQVMCETADGFRIAEEDLKLRGPGEFFGTRQHGMPELMIGNVIEDYDLLRLARSEAFDWIAKDPAMAGPESEPIRRALVKRFKDTMRLIEVG